jgi:hypothetical protein
MTTIMYNPPLRQGSARSIRKPSHLFLIAWHDITFLDLSFYEATPPFYLAGFEVHPAILV